MTDQAHVDKLVLQARQSGQSIIFAAPHLDNWELSVFALARNVPLAYFYLEPQQRDKACTTIKGRANLGGTPSTMDITANTQTLLPGLAQRTGALLMFGFMERLDWRHGWRLRYVAANSGVYDTDKQKAAAAVNRSIETCVHIARNKIYGATGAFSCCLRVECGYIDGRSSQKRGSY